MKHFLLFLLGLVFLMPLAAQDTLVASSQDSVAIKAASDITPKVNAKGISKDSSIRYLLRESHLLFTHDADRQVLPMLPKIEKKEDWLFYYLLSLLMIFALILASQRKYFSDLFRVFFRTSLRVNQIREQLVQSGLPSLLFNLFFFISGGSFLFLLLRYANHPAVAHPYQLLAGSILFTAALYACKFIILHFSGWIFGMPKITETYVFIVFMINKVVGVLLIPFLMVIAFSPRSIADVMVTVALCFVAALFLYRFLRAFGTVNREINLSRFHFLLYLLGFEVAPLLVIYRVFTLYF